MEECNCNKLQVMPEEQAQLEDTDAYFHEHTCPLYIEGNDANAMRKHLNGVELFMHSDLVLQLLPQKNMVRRPNVLGIGSMSDGKPNYVVEWLYPGLTLRLERAIFNHAQHGKVFMYAVQRIMWNNDKKSTIRKGSKDRRRANKRARSAHDRRN